MKNEAETAVLVVANDGTLETADAGAEPVLEAWGIQPGGMVPDSWLVRLTTLPFGSHAIYPLVAGDYRYWVCAIRTPEALTLRLDRNPPIPTQVGAIVADLGHELRTPLNVILGMTDLTLGSTLRDDQRQWLTTARENLEQLATRIDDLLGTATQEPAPTPLSLLRGHSVVVDPDPKPATRVLLVEDNPDNQVVMRALLERAGHNVVVAEHGEAALTVFGESTFDLVLMDLDLPGIDGLETTRRLRGLERSIRRPALPIVAVTAHSARGIRQACHDAGMDDIVHKPVSASELLGAVERWTRGRPVILVADDGEASRRLSLRYLSAEPWLKVIEAVNGKEVLDIIARERVSVLLLDMEMPVLNGFETAAAIRRLPGFAELPIIALTAHETADQRERALAAGCTDFLVKPLHRAVLLENIATHLDRQERTDDSQGEVVWLDHDVADLVPAYLAARAEDLDHIRAFIGQRSFEPIAHIAHRLKGSGSAYGFDPITELGRKMGEAAHAEDADGVQHVLEQLSRYLSRVDVRYRVS